MDRLRDFIRPPPPAWLDRLPPSLRSLAASLPSVAHFLYLYLVLPILNHIHSFTFQLQRLARAPLSELAYTDILPPIISLVLIYLAVTSALRTARFAFNFGMWAAKWGTLIVLVAVVWGYFTEGGAAATDRGRDAWDTGVMNRAWQAMTGPPPPPPQHDYLLDVQEMWNEWLGEWVPWNVEADVRGGWWADWGQHRDERPKAGAWDPSTWGKRDANRESDKARKKPKASRVR